ncbi:MAG: head GIN domain-containing protein [Gaiellaceae bacterium]
MKTRIGRVRCRLAAAAAVLLLATALAGCDVHSTRTLQGSGVLATSVRATAPFSRVELDAPMKMTIAVGPGRSLVVRGDDNLLGEVQTRVRGGTLTVSVHRSFRAHEGLAVSVTIPRLDFVALTGAGEIDARGVRGRSFGADLTGTGTITARGRVARMSVSITGAGEALLDRLVADDVVADVTGVGTARVWANRSLVARLTGVGNILYGGDPTRVSRDVTGLGAVSAI